MARIFEIGSFRLDADVGALTRDGRPMALGTRAVAVLAALVERANQYVSKASLLDAAWPHAVVEEGNVAMQIVAIRRVLAEVGGAKWIETLPRRGYRFVGPVKELTDERPSSQRSNLPAPLTSFIGRERELVEIRRLLASKRLVTVVGAGGIGKTRFAFQAAAEVVDAYRDGVWIAELASIRDSALVPTMVAHALGIQERAGTPAVESLRGYLKSRQVLLILDNCEHLLKACAQLADVLLQQAAGLTIIATSREPLRLAGEQTYPVQPLSLPERGAELETMQRSEAVQLFVERVQRQMPDFELTPDRIPAIADICIHLDGIALALELAAARAPSLSVEQINAHLRDRFRLLTSGSRSALPRQQTLRATLDWSYDLLAEDERAAWRRLAIFPGSFTVEAASAVASDAAIDDFTVIDLLSRLVTRSLLIADTSAARTRYRLLETTRAYALDKLGEVGETDLCRGRHARYLCRLFDHAPNEWWRMPDLDWRAAYLLEVDNVRGALDWVLGAGDDSVLGVRLTAGSGPLWTGTGLWNEGVGRLQTALAAVGPETRALDHARLWFWLGVLSNQVPAESLANFEYAVDLYRGTGDVAEIGFSLMRAGAAQMYLGRTERAATLLGEAAPLLERAGLPKALAEYFLHFGTLKWFTGDLTGARVELEKSAVLCEQSGTARVALGVRAGLAELAWTSGDLDAALARYSEAVALARRDAKQEALGMYLTNLAGVHVERGELDAALVAAREGVPWRREFGDALWALDHLALRMALKNNLVTAARIAGHADYGMANHAAERQPNEARARERVQAILLKNLPVDEVERLLSEGAKMTEDDACEIALEE